MSGLLTGLWKGATWRRRYPLSLPAEQRRSVVVTAVEPDYGHVLLKTLTPERGAHPRVMSERRVSRAHLRSQYELVAGQDGAA